MVNYCRVHGCHNRSDREKNLQYYRLPLVITNQGEVTQQLSEERRRLWMASLNQNFDGKTLSNIRVCSAHFVSGKHAPLYSKDDPDWVPSLKMCAAEKSVAVGADGGVTSLAAERFNRRQKRTQKKIDLCAAESLLLLNAAVCVEEPDCAEPHNQPKSIATQTELTAEQIDSMSAELQALRTENQQLRAEVSNHTAKWDQNGFRENNDKVLFFTGIQNWQTLFTLFTYLAAYLPEKNSVNKFQLLIITLMRLRLNVSAKFLAYEFGVSLSTVSRIITDVITVMYVRMSPLVVWPERELLRKTMPMQFRKHFGSKCAVIIDCFEVFIDRPSNLKARAETWSSYKHHNTVKFLIGITPQGTVSFISKAWGGRTSDKYITEHCGFLDRILPGDLILADRGFDIEATIGSMMAQVKIPAFTKGQSQLSPVDVETTRQIAHVRIHVERVIGCVRQKYTILNGPIPVDFLTCRDSENVALIDMIGFVCCALVNLSPSLVGSE